MDYQQFVAVIKEKVAQSLGDGMSLEIRTTLKNNGRERIGLTISQGETNISPTIYLEEYYQQFEKGNSPEDIVESLLDVYHEVNFEHTWQIHSIKDFAEIQSKIVYKVISAGKNEEFLKAVPVIYYLDLAIVFYILFEVDDSGTATIPITNELMELWGTNARELYEIAKKNSPLLLPATLKPMRVVIEELLGNECESCILDDDIMFVLTNQLRNFGAACILYGDILEQINGQLDENYYILPSSIHEVIIIPESQSPGKEQLLEMVAEINETQVDPEEVLSNQVYYYDSNIRALINTY